MVEGDDGPVGPVMLEGVTCPACRRTDVLLSGRSGHTRADCAACGSFVKYVARAEVRKALGGPLPAGNEFTTTRGLRELLSESHDGGPLPPRKGQS